MSFTLTFLSSFSSKEHCINKYFKSIPLFSQFLRLQSSFCLSNINKWLVNASLLKIYKFFLIYAFLVSPDNFSFEKCHPSNLECVSVYKHWFSKTITLSTIKFIDQIYGSVLNRQQNFWLYHKQQLQIFYSLFTLKKETDFCKKLSMILWKLCSPTFL